MISCIICSRTNKLQERLQSNIGNTVGCEYELLVIDNSKNQYDIFSAYNEGVKRAKGDILCFMHEDILFHSDNWGREVIQLFSDQSVGIIGVLGTQFMPHTLAAWWWSGCTVGHVLQSRGKRLGQNNTYINGNPINDDVNAVIVDGLWFCVRRSMFDKVSYDENTYSGFHGYDHDLCMQVINQGKRVIITNKVLIEHASEGDVGSGFLEQLQRFYDKWESCLPVMRGIEIDSVAAARIANVVKMLEREVRFNVMVKESKSYLISHTISEWLHKIVR